MIYSNSKLIQILFVSKITCLSFCFYFIKYDVKENEIYIDD